MTTTSDAAHDRLNQERARLLEEIGALGYLHSDRTSANTEYQHYSNHMADIATETFEQAKGLALELHLRRRLQSTEEALRRLEGGSYGVCSNCGRAIDPERLEVLPEATLCIECQKSAEAQR